MRQPLFAIVHFAQFFQKIARDRNSRRTSAGGLVSLSSVARVIRTFGDRTDFGSRFFPRLPVLTWDSGLRLRFALLF